MLAVKAFISLVISYFGEIITFFSNSASNDLMLGRFGVFFALISITAAVYVKHKRLNKEIEYV